MRPQGPVTVCFPFMGHEVGGSHISSFKLIARLDRSRYEPLVLVHEPGSEVDELLKTFGIPREVAPGGRVGKTSSVPSALARSFAAASLLRRRNVRIVHTNDGESHLVWALAAHLSGAKLVWHHRGNPTAQALRWVAPWAADWVVAVSRFASPRPGFWSAARKCSVVHSPFDRSYARVDRAASRDAAVRDLGVSPETKLIGFFGNLVPRKRPLVFVEAIAALKKSAPEMPMLGLLFGNAQQGLDREVLDLAQRLGVAGAVRLMGFRYPPERWLAACDIVLSPSIEEPFSRSIIEAMLIGTPVVASRSGGNVEAISDGRTGLLVPVDRGDLMGAAALSLLRDPSRLKAIADTAQAEALGQFGVDRHVTTVMEIYDRLLKSREPQISLVGPRAMADAHD